jgi:hypothetical protein
VKTCLCYVQGSKTLSECSNVDQGERQLHDTMGKKSGCLVSLSFTFEQFDSDFFVLALDCLFVA